ncbi:hypothetical protein KAZ82_02315 [Candidatus Babeliales bacterium]|nr:hypothetical protein [Candidatus Babeliales bacterium]
MQQIKSNLIKIFFSFYIVFNFLKLSADPLLVAVLMVKNEEPVMEMTLQPLVNAGITDFFIYDTGSTDNTIAVTQEFFQNNNISNYVIKQGEWIDFAASRNQALDLTEQYFPNAKFMLMLDAEWILHGGHELLQFCAGEQNSLDDLFYIRLCWDGVDFYHARLIRCRSDIRFKGKVHETPDGTPYLIAIPSIYFSLDESAQARHQKSGARWIRDRDILLQEAACHPDDTRTLFYLAQTYMSLCDYENAIAWYHKRLALHGFDEEDYFACYALALAYGLSGDADSMIFYNLKAYEMRRHRADPLIQLAQYFFQVQAYDLAYLFVRHACTIPFPERDVLFIERFMYDFVRYDLLSAVAYYEHDFKLGYIATQKALQTCPSAVHLQDNLKKYQQALGVE